ncbi:hypothetical protein KM043_003724 [Ampulex compressa]|nr:hypothetical protein KM043_003724 [Ampulex compressa]
MPTTPVGRCQSIRRCPSNETLGAASLPVRCIRTDVNALTRPVIGARSFSRIREEIPGWNPLEARSPPFRRDKEASTWTRYPRAEGIALPVIPPRKSRGKI